MASYPTPANTGWHDKWPLVKCTRVERLVRVHVLDVSVQVYVHVSDCASACVCVHVYIHARAAGYNAAAVHARTGVTRVLLWGV